MSDPHTPSPARGLRWHKLSAVSFDGREIEVLAATCIDGIGVVVRWQKEADGWEAMAMDTEGGGWDFVEFYEEGNEIPVEPPEVWDDLPPEHSAAGPRIERLCKALSGLIGAETKEELDMMEAGLRILPGVEEDKIAAINAIHALLAELAVKSPINSNPAKDQSQ